MKNTLKQFLTTVALLSAHILTLISFMYMGYSATSAAILLDKEPGWKNFWGLAIWFLVVMVMAAMITISKLQAEKLKKTMEERIALLENTKQMLVETNGEIVRTANDYRNGLLHNQRKIEKLESRLRNLGLPVDYDEEEGEDYA